MKPEPRKMNKTSGHTKATTSRCRVWHSRQRTQEGKQRHGETAGSLRPTGKQAFLRLVRPISYCPFQHFRIFDKKEKNYTRLIFLKLKNFCHLCLFLRHPFHTANSVVDHFNTELFQHGFQEVQSLYSEEFNRIEEFDKVYFFYTWFMNRQHHNVVIGRKHIQITCIMIK